MAKFSVQGVEEYALKLSKLGDRVMMKTISGKAIFASANIVANQIKQNILALPSITDAENIRAYRKGEKSGITEKQKKGLIDAFGISKMELDRIGYYNVKLGFDGYNSVKTKKYPKGQPNPLIARVINSGSTYMDKHPFVDSAVRNAKKAAIEEMNRVIDEEMTKYME